MEKILIHEQFKSKELYFFLCFLIGFRGYDKDSILDDKQIMRLVEKLNTKDQINFWNTYYEAQSNPKNFQNLRIELQALIKKHSNKINPIKSQLGMWMVAIKALDTLAKNKKTNQVKSNGK